MRTLAIGLFLFALFAAGWTALWFFAAHQAGAWFDAILKAEDEQGRSWTCPNRMIGGYPASITIHCTKPTFAGTASSQTVTGEVAALAGEASVFHPRQIDIALQPPLRYRTSDGAADLSAQWSSLIVAIDGLLPEGTVKLAGRDLVVEGDFGESGQQGGKADGLDGLFRVVSEGGSPMLDISIALHGASIPAADAVLGGQAPLDVALAGQVSQIDVGDVRTPEQAIDRWREKGGQAALQSVQIDRSGSSMSASGTLMLDDTHRPEGRLNASFVGLEPILKRYGLSGNLATAGQLLGALFGAPPRADTAPNAINLPITFKSGRLSVGPIRTPITLSPVY